MVWAFQNAEPIIQSSQLTNKKRTKSITTYDFLTLYTQQPHDKLKSENSSIADFAFKRVDKIFIKLSSNAGAYGGIKQRRDLLLV